MVPQEFTIYFMFAHKLFLVLLVAHINVKRVSVCHCQTILGIELVQIPYHETKECIDLFKKEDWQFGYYFQRITYIFIKWVILGPFLKYYQKKATFFLTFTNSTHMKRCNWSWLVKEKKPFQENIKIINQDHNWFIQTQTCSSTNFGVLAITILPTAQSNVSAVTKQ